MSESQPIDVAILTVSDSASVNRDNDQSGPAIKTLLDEASDLSGDDGLQFTCNLRSVVPDDVQRIQETVSSWAKHWGVDLVVTTGGTGLGARDCTPEAIKSILDREAPGIVHLLLSSSLQHTPYAALSRPIAGTIGRTLVITLPGSVRAVKESMEALLKSGIIPHAIELLRGGSGEQLHAALAAEGTTSAAGQQEQPHHHHHHHHHHHRHGHGHGHGEAAGKDDGYQIPQPRTHDPSAPVSTRHRESPFPILSFEQAMELIMTKTKPLPVFVLPVNSSLRGHVLAEDVHAPQAVPLTPTTNVDGYALRSSDPPGTYNVLTSQTHTTLSTPLPTGCIYRINTGGPLPTGTDAVIMVEDTRLISTHHDDGMEREEEKEVETLAQVSAGENVRKPGSDVKQGDLVMGAGERVLGNGGEVGTLTFVGRKEVKVVKRPVVAILSTGNELVDLQDPKPMSGEGWGGVFDTNRPSLRATLESMGYEVVDVGIVADTVDAHVKAIEQGLQNADVLLTTGGTSMGPTDLLKPVIERTFKGTIHFGRVAIKPGKPTTFATVPFSDGKAVIEKLVFALPGNPASALVTFHVFVLPALRKLGGWQEKMCQLPRVPVKLMSEMYLDPRVEFHRVVIKVDGEGLKAYSTGGQRSSRVASLSGANGFVVLPSKSIVPAGRLEAGTIAPAIVIGEIQMN
ncbi:hypothetical protein AMATHDRAFT_75774 [Amanita thiersii Skay4041]|uniref:MoaB/Mog domain-containing protein n=1 Tax=Amanita thiersii Skay4041 TaxID=703135 RepID=A0A2A9NP90_9AGAR|nr:hypothetical protein AMATHDRAFT_75774 [Amanita thiersii Skay4041]